ncbi:MAG: HAMP domain-containing histidine kinase [Ignavibacteria bacterium]|jgi:signal transduction histidine kinase|nr:HAMP domain-containing histidine kinase [Ignavibacteria bacterium]
MSLRSKISPFVKFIIKIVIVASILAVIIVVSYASNLLVDQVIRREKQELQTFANTYRYYVTATDVESALFFLEAITPNIYFPMIITDGNDEPIQDYESFTLNMDELKYITSIDVQHEYLVAQIKKMKRTYPPIIVPDANGQIIAKFYYTHSNLVDMLRFFPLVSVLMVMTIVIIGYWAFNGARNNEQSRLWVGMARETAHQLGTPISSLLAWIELLKLNRDAPESIDETADEIEKDVERLNMIATRFSKIGSNPDMQQLNVSEELNEICDYYERRLPHLAGKISIYKDYDTNLYIQANATLFSWVFENLIKNAVEAMDGKPGELYITAKQLSKNKLQFLIKDSGKGMNKKMRLQIFEPGFTTKKRGWGMGLSLVRRIIEEYHHGKIYVKESAIGKGTTFAIELPNG